ncbi:Sterol 3-beta-glucosyltransferase, partial [Phytophthora palmivora]
MRHDCKFHDWNERFKATFHKESKALAIAPPPAVEDVRTAGIAVHDQDGRIRLDVAEEEEIDLDALRRRSRSTLDEDEDLKLEKAHNPPVLNICIMIVGTRGDVQPFLAIAQRLQQDGHRVRLATHAIYRDFVTSYGVEFYPLGGDPKELAAYMVKTGGHLIPTKMETLQKDVPRNMQMIDEILHSTWPAVSAADPEGGGPGVKGKPFRAQAIISNPVTYGHIHVAERLGKRNYLSYKLVDLLMWQGTEGKKNEFRTQVLNEIHQLVPKPKDWGDLYDVVGTVVLREQLAPYRIESEDIPALLEVELDLYGKDRSMVLEDPKATTKMIIDAAKQ